MATGFRGSHNYGCNCPHRISRNLQVQLLPTMAATCAGPPLANGLQPLSCLRCAHRKVRCDRVAPCKNCIKHNAACEFPQPKSEKRRRRKMVIASPPQTKLRSRTLSAGVESLSGSLQGRITDSPQRAQNPPRERADIAAGFPDSHLVVFGNQSRYFEGELWTKIGREVRIAPFK